MSDLLVLHVLPQAQRQDDNKIPLTAMSRNVPQRQQCACWRGGKGEGEEDSELISALIIKEETVSDMLC